MRGTSHGRSTTEQAYDSRSGWRQPQQTVASVIDRRCICSKIYSKDSPSG